MREKKKAEKTDRPRRVGLDEIVKPDNIIISASFKCFKCHRRFWITNHNVKTDDNHCPHCNEDLTGQLSFMVA